MFVGMKDVCSIGIDEESSDADPQSNGGFSDVQPPAASQTAEQPTETGTASSAAEEAPKSPSTSQPVPKPRSSKNAAVKEPVPDVPPLVQQLTPPTTVPSPSPSPVSSLPLPIYTAVGHSKSAPESLGHESATAVAKGPLPSIPPPPPLPIKLSSAFGKARTKAFHWDAVSSDKVAPPLEVQTSFVRKHLNIICLR